MSIKKKEKEKMSMICCQVKKKASYRILYTTWLMFININMCIYIYILIDEETLWADTLSSGCLWKISHWKFAPFCYMIDQVCQSQKVTPNARTHLLSLRLKYSLPLGPSFVVKASSLHLQMGREYARRQTKHPHPHLLTPGFLL